MWHARVAQWYVADMLVIGKQRYYAIRKGNEERWKKLIERVREVYKGPIGYAATTIETYSAINEFPCEVLDYVIIYLYNKISEKENPSIEELKSAFEKFNRDQFEEISRKCGKKVIFLIPFQSRDFGAKQVWFEPAAPAPHVKQDFLIQAKMYEAFFQSVADEDWVKGVWAWGYWWRDDFDTKYLKGDSSFHKSSSVRNKPAMMIIKK